jgi:predicted kinase
MNIKDAMHHTVHDYPGGSESLGPRMNIVPAVLRNKVNPNSSSHHLTLIEADRLMSMTGDHRILNALAQNHGYVLVPVEFDTPASDLAILELVTRVWRTNGDVGKAVDEALCDGKITSKELEHIQDTITQVEQAMHTMLSRLKELV